MKNKYGVFDSSARKIVGILNVDNGFGVDVNGDVINPAELLAAYNGCDITIFVGEKSEDMV